jgi:hypothetical protein
VNHPTGRECDEGDCQWLAPKRNALDATSDLKPNDYECIGKEKDWPDCPRTIRWRLERAERLGDALAQVATNAQFNLNCPYCLGKLNAALTAWRNRGQS